MICSKLNTAATEKYKLGEKKNHYFQDSRNCWCCRGVFALEIGPVLYLFGLGFFCFCVFLKSVQDTQGCARHHSANILLPRRLFFKALHLLQWNGEVKKVSATFLESLLAPRSPLGLWEVPTHWHLG